MIKLIASDIDGTLVKDGTLAIDREYMEVIGRLIDKGIVFVACSGRQYRSERKLFTPVADRLLYISDGGTVVRTPKEILKVDTLPDEIWKGMCSMVQLPPRSPGCRQKYLPALLGKRSSANSEVFLIKDTNYSSSYQYTAQKHISFRVHLQES